MSLYESALPNVFPYRVPCSEELAQAAVRQLMEESVFTPRGSSFALIPNLFTSHPDQERTLWLSKASRERLIKHRFEVSDEIHHEYLALKERARKGL
jgi:hypothetical protein